MSDDFVKLYAELRASIEENIRQFRAQRRVPEDSLITAEQVGGADMRPRGGQRAAHVIIDETHRLMHPPFTVEGVAAKYATAPNTGPVRDWQGELRAERQMQELKEWSDAITYSVPQRWQVGGYTGGTPNTDRVAGIVHQAEHWGDDYRG